ncbi:MAG: hypothetical protein IKH11_06785 [Bacteroidales bacterium]|nr:hypothetical protein [Bacteroidales bacterium]
MKKCLIIFWRSSLTFLLLLGVLVCIFSVSPIYDFRAPEPFSGPDIYNPYAGLPSDPEWKRANFHTHTRVDNVLNECPGYPAEVYSDYKKLGYDVLAFSNHNQLTRHPFDSTLQINVYEHGYGLFKLHKLVFNPSGMILFDHLLPLFVSQKQWQYDYLSRNADFIVMNHPDRTWGMGTRSMQLLTGYRLMEADCGVSSELCRWDEALSAGHYSHCLINDDCHDSGNHRKIARRCSWLSTPSERYEDLKATLLSGAFYSMRVPDFGDGDRAVKLDANSHLPEVLSIGVKGDTVFLKLSAPAHIEARGQGHKLLASADGCSFERPLAADEPYMRLSAFFDSGVVIYSNAFARYDKSEEESPYKVAGHSVNVFLTIVFNLALLLLLLLLVKGLRGVWKAR